MLISMQKQLVDKLSIAGNHFELKDGKNVKQKKNNKMKKKPIDPSTFLFRDTTVEKFLNNMKAKTQPPSNKRKTFEGPFGTGFVTKKPKTTA